MTGETMGSRGEQPRRLRERYDDRGKQLEQGDDPAREVTSAASTSEVTKRDTRVMVGDYDDQRSKMMTTRRAR